MTILARTKTSMRMTVAAVLLATLVAAIWPGRPAQAESEDVYIAAIDLVIVPQDIAKYLEAVRENAAASIREPGVRAFNVSVLAGTPNHVFLYEVYANEAAWKAHRESPHFKKYMATTASMIAERTARTMSSVSYNAKAP